MESTIEKGLFVLSGVMTRLGLTYMNLDSEFGIVMIDSLSFHNHFEQYQMWKLTANQFDKFKVHAQLCWKN